MQHTCGAEEHTHTDNSTPVKFTIVSFSEARQLKHREEFPILQNKTMAEKCLPSFYVCYGLELHLCLCTRSTSSLKDYMQPRTLSLSLSHPILNRHMGFPSSDCIGRQ